MSSSTITTNIQTTKLALVLTSGVAAIAAISYLYWSKYKGRCVPKEWKQMAEVTILNLYPLKSGYRVEIQKADCTDFGIEEINDRHNVMKLRDRAFIVYDANDYALKTARTFPKMVLMEMAAVNKNQVSIDAPEMHTLVVTIPKQGDKHVKEVHIVHHQTERIWGLDCGDEAAKWLSKYLYNKTSGARLAYHDGSKDHRRNITNTHKKQINVFPKLSNKSTGLFSDLSSYHLVNEASVDDLNKRCSETISVHNFRAPIVISGLDAPAYIEDTWNYIRIGDEAIFRTVQPCTRCAMTTIHPEKGERSQNREPLKTLEGYRKLKDPKQFEVDSSPVMGQYLELIKPGVIKVGDGVFVEKLFLDIPN